LDSPVARLARRLEAVPQGEAPVEATPRQSSAREMFLPENYLNAACFISLLSDFYK
jgi:hypothetical protein